jgi:hypothetical protein
MRRMKMTNFEKLKSLDIDQLVEWLDENGHHDAVWWKWFEETYCEKCPTETVYIDDHEGEHIWKTECECSYCEIHDKCRFFQEMDDVPDSKETIKLWLESETTDEEV